MRLQFGLLVLLSCSLTSCRTTDRISLTRDTLVGHYVYKSEDPDGKLSEHEYDNLILRSDGSYDLVQGGSTKPRTEKIGRWSFVGGENPSIGLDEAGYPIRTKRDEIRLLVDDDVRIWYAKTR
jgi:hypothetical protein